MSLREGSSYDFYNRNGVPGPSVDEHGLKDTLENPISAQISQASGHIHSWVQRGNFIECSRGNFVHGQPIPVNMLLQGTQPDGQPILKELTIAPHSG
jgi:hypothetical protein